MTNPTKVEGIDYSAEGINDIRAQLINARTGAMDQGAWDWVIIFSHAIAMLAYLVELDGGDIDEALIESGMSESDFISKLHARLVEDSTPSDPR